MISVRPSKDSKSWISTALDSGQIEVPIFPLSEVPEFNCAGYARLAAQEIFHKRFTRCDAWDRRFYDRLVAVINNGSLKRLTHSGVLQPGMIIGVSNPESHYLAQTDVRGNQVEYTHNVLYLGNDPKGNIMVADMFEEWVFVRNEQELLNASLTPREIFDEPAK